MTKAAIAYSIIHALSTWKRVHVGSAYIAIHRDCRLIFGDLLLANDNWLYRVYINASVNWAAYTLFMGLC